MSLVIIDMFSFNHVMPLFLNFLWRYLERQGGKREVVEM